MDWPTKEDLIKFYLAHGFSREKAERKAEEYFKLQEKFREAYDV